jgi:CheY-like chemotaxis protein
MHKNTDFYNQYAGKALRALVVDDDQVNLLMISRLLTQKGYTVQTAINGLKALSILGNETFDIVLMDISMPKIDGIALTRKMKKYVHTQNIPVVAMTTYLSEKEREHLLAAGLDGYIAKPVDPAELYNIILQLTCADYSILDKNGLIMRTGGDREFMRDITELFCHTSTEAVDEMKKNSDMQIVIELAHKLKGSAETVGARTVVGIAQHIRNAALQSDFESINNACADFDKNLDQFKQSLANIGIIVDATEK